MMKFGKSLKPVANPKKVEVTEKISEEVSDKVHKWLDNYHRNNRAPNSEAERAVETPPEIKEQQRKDEGSSS